ncbi:helix-turn-helix domain-containing protein [Pseudobacteroides cellulosolvens]|uniref:Transcriptional regulator, XRE family n=1 Tax=Pseudobacteroides cellulosolvens ATCC 35603 = DSM 2933 TaxID=398512 RepID=A0A0L6JXH6_9FIRM|nr:helix-turn-helix domain-containing protein [Pseudobacteroides cellulosolvens]KNY30449.1 transcriptional regulator, XRE family [Pseudobacteroides cellulosolvens ATCC 35603 = DSM 2933]
MSRLGNEISRLRKEVGMTHKQLAKIVGVSKAFIIDVESGKKILSEDLVNKISKALRKEIGKVDLYDDEKYNKPEPDPKVVRIVEKPVQDVWNDALAGVLAAVPVYNYKMDKALNTKKMPIISNKVEGYPKDKVFYLSVEDDDMAGFRIGKGDVALCHSTHEFEKDGIYFVEINDRRVVRQIKSIDASKFLVVSNRGSLITTTLFKKDVKVLAKLIKLEIVF